MSRYGVSRNEQEPPQHRCIDTGTGTSPWDVLPLSDDTAVVSDSLSDDLTGLTAVDFKSASQ